MKMKFPFPFSCKMKLPGVAILLILFVAGSVAEAQAQRRYRVTFKDEGYTNITEGVAHVPSNLFKAGFGFHTINGYQVNANVSAGLGVGIATMDENLFIPIFADGRYYFLEGKYSPFLMGRVGYAVNIEETSGSGLMGAGGVGMKIFFTGNFACHALLGYRLQQIPNELLTEPGIPVQEGSQTYSAFTISLGFQL